MPDTDWIVLLSAAALAFSVMNYVLLDGTDLGVGVLMGLTPCGKDRRAMAVTILPIWDANETWLVLRRRSAGVVPIGLRHPASGALLAIYLDVSGADSSRRCVGIS